MFSTITEVWGKACLSISRPLGIWALSLELGRVADNNSLRKYSLIAVVDPEDRPGSVETHLSGALDIRRSVYSHVSETAG